MSNAYKFIKNTWWLLLILFLAPIIVIAVFASKEYFLHQIDLTAGDWAGLWGSAFAYWGTVILGTLAFWQNAKIQENNDLLITFEKNKVAPVFSILLEEYQGMLENLKFKLSNCSDNIACNLDISDMEIYTTDNAKKTRNLIDKVPVKNTNKVNVLEAHSQSVLEYKNKALKIETGKPALLIITIKSSDIIGSARKTIVEIYFNANLECTYNYKVEIL